MGDFLNNFETQLRRLGQIHERMQAKLETSMRDKNQFLATLIARLEVVNRSVQNFQQQIQRMNDSIILPLQQQLAENQREIDGLNESLGRFTQNATTLTRERDEALDRLRITERELETLKQQLSDLQQRQQQLVQQQQVDDVPGLRREIQECQQQRQQIQQELTDVQAQMQGRETQLANIQGQINANDETLRQTQAENQRLTATNTQLTDRIIQATTIIQESMDRFEAVINSVQPNSVENREIERIIRLLEESIGDISATIQGRPPGPQGGPQGRPQGAPIRGGIRKKSKKSKKQKGGYIYNLNSNRRSISTNTNSYTRKRRRRRTRSTTRSTSKTSSNSRSNSRRSSSY